MTWAAAYRGAPLLLRYESSELSVLADGGHVSKAVVARLHKVIARFPFDNGNPNNNRPLQLLNGRVARLRCGGKHD